MFITTNLHVGLWVCIKGGARKEGELNTSKDTIYIAEYELLHKRVRARCTTVFSVHKQVLDPFAHAKNHGPMYKQYFESRK